MGEPFYPQPKGAPEDKEAKPKGMLYHTPLGAFIVHVALILPWLLGAFVIIGECLASVYAHTLNDNHARQPMTPNGLFLYKTHAVLSS